PPRQPLDSPSVVRTRSDVGEDEMRDPLGSRGGERKRGAASHGKADNRNLVEVERIDDTGEVAAEMSARVTAGGGPALPNAVSALIIGDDRMAIGQFPPLVKPHPLAAGEPVYEDHGLTAAGDAIGELDITDANAARRVGHAHRRR